MVQTSTEVEGAGEQTHNFLHFGQELCQLIWPLSPKGFPTVATRSLQGAGPSGEKKRHAFLSQLSRSTSGNEEIEAQEPSTCDYD